MYTDAQETPRGTTRRGMNPALTRQERNLSMNRSSYSYQVVGQVIAIIDHNEGRSVTNDVRNVLDDLKQAGLDLCAHRLIYRDTLGTWDELLTDPRGNFGGFRSINVQTLDAA